MPIEDIWENFGRNEVYEVVENEGDGSSVVSSVFESFGIPFSGIVDSSLPGVDIKRMDAMQVINLCLLEHLSKSGNLCELVVDETGQVTVINVGSVGGSMTDVYYSMDGESYIEKPSGVIVRGTKPVPKWKPLEWVPIWGDGSKKKIHDTTVMITNCSISNFNTHAIITFPNPNLSTDFKLGLDMLHKNVDTFDKVLGYAFYIEHGGEYTKDTKVSYADESTIPVLVGKDNPDMGTLVAKPVIDPESDLEGNSECWAWTSFEGEGGDDSKGLEIPIPEEIRFDNVRGTTVDYFRGVSEIILIGKELTMVKTSPKEGQAMNEASSNNAIAYIEIEDPSVKSFRLSEGKHYIIKYDNSEGTVVPRILFSKGVSEKNPLPFGKDTEYVIGLYGDVGAVMAGKEGKATIFPLEQNRGIMVHEIWAMVDIDSPSISIYDPHQEDDPATSSATKATNIAENLKYMIAPIIIDDQPGPIAFNGELLDQTKGIADTDPTTTQNLEDTPLEEAFDSMSSGGSGMDIFAPFCSDPGKVAALSQNILSIISDAGGSETTYVCGPGVGVVYPGGAFAGGVVNNVTYSYNDSSSFTVSVNVGAVSSSSSFSSGSGIGGPHFMITESYSAEGTIIGSAGNGIHFKVRIDGYGDRQAINMSPSILRIGDVVNCTIHNNPVEA
jgi:hypothetical protein